jgi:hypothetical protein
MPLRVKREHFPTWGRKVPWLRGIDDPDAMVPVVSRPQDIHVFVTGGPGKQSSVIPAWGPSRSVTLPIEH